LTGYVDLQVNGFGGVDFNSDDVTDEEITEACRALREDGADRVLATVITDALPRMQARIARLAKLRAQDEFVRDVLLGIHVEGPFLNPSPGFVGAHPVEHVIPGNTDDAKRLVDAGDGSVQLMTLAPEQDPNCSVTRWLTDAGIGVAAGHCDSSRDQLRSSIDQGLKLFTHLGNGCPALLDRHDNIIQRALSFADEISISLIADSHHIPLFALRNYLDLIPGNRVIIVSDAISAAALGPGTYPLSGQMVHVDESLAAWSEDREHFAGSATSIGKMREILQRQLGMNERWLRAATRENPLALLGQPTT